MRKICVINQKGGVAKTTTTINLGFGLAREGKKVLIIDLDAQGNIATCLGVETQKDIYDLLIENAEPQECITHVADNLDVLPSCESVAKAEMILVGESRREHILKKKLNKLNGYDYILLDCPPSLGLINQNAMLFATEAIIPTSTDLLGVDGLRKMVAALQQMNKVFDHDIVISKVIPTLFDTRSNVCKNTLSVIQNEFYTVVSEPIRMNTKLKELAGKKKPIFKC